MALLKFEPAFVASFLDGMIGYDATVEYGDIIIVTTTEEGTAIGRFIRVDWSIYEEEDDVLWLEGENGDFLSIQASYITGIDFPKKRGKHEQTSD